MRLGLFGRRDPDKSANRGEAARIAAGTKTLLRLPEDAVVAVNEILCADPACPGTETVILVMTPGEKTKALKLPCEMAAVTDALLRDGMRRQGWLLA